jgi:hypothetical protein
MNASIQKSESSQINNLTIYLNLLERQKQAKPKSSGQKEIMKIRAEINKIENKRKI